MNDPMNQPITFAGLRAASHKRYNEGLGTIEGTPEELHAAARATINAVHDALEASLQQTGLKVDHASDLIQETLTVGVISVVNFVASQFVRSYPDDLQKKLAIGAMLLVLKKGMEAEMNSNLDKQNAGFRVAPNFNPGDLN